MKLMKLLVVLLALLLLPFTIKVKGQDFGRSQSLFTDIKAHKVGDILSVNIFEQAKASSKVETKTEKSNTASTRGGPGIGTLDFFPLFGADYESDNEFHGKGKNLRNGSLRARMSVTVMAVKDNGDLIIEGTRIIGISGDRETITLSGVVRSEDIAADNSIASYLIADASIHYTGKGNAQSGSRPGFLARLFNWIF